MQGTRDGAWWAFVVVLVLAHLVLHVALGYGAGLPDFISIAVLLSARRMAGAQAALLALVLGLLADALSLTAFGATAVAFVVLSWIGVRTRDLFEGGSYLFTAFYLFLGKWLIDAIYLLVSPDARRSDGFGSLIGRMPLFALYTAIAGALALAAYRMTVGERRGR